MRQELVDSAVTSPLTAIASYGFLKNGKGHPRTAGCYSKILGHYVRDLKSLSLMDAIRKISLMPAQRLESLAPAFKQKATVLKVKRNERRPSESDRTKVSDA